MATINKCLTIYITAALLFLGVPSDTYATISASLEQKDQTSATITLDFNLDQEHITYRDYLDVSGDTPGMSLSMWMSRQKPIVQYDHRFKQDKSVYKGPFSLQVHANLPEVCANKQVYLHVTYYSTTTKGLVQELVPVDLPSSLVAPSADIAYAVDAADSTVSVKPIPEVVTQQETPLPSSHTPAPTTSIITSLSIWPTDRLIAFLVGILLIIAYALYPLLRSITHRIQPYQLMACCIALPSAYLLMTTVIPHYILLYLASCMTLGIAYLCLQTAYKHPRWWQRMVMNILGIVLVAASVIVAALACRVM